MAVLEITVIPAGWGPWWSILLNAGPSLAATSVAWTWTPAHGWHHIEAPLTHDTARN